MKRTTRHANIPALIRAMIEGGAIFRHTDCGAWLVDNLPSLPCDLRDEFFEADERELAAELRRIETEPIPAELAAR